MIQIAYRDTNPNGTSSPPVVLIHGSPGTSGVFKRLIPLLSPRFRVIAPDLPGFGDSTRDIPDYSFLAHARYIEELLDSLHAPKAHLIGYSMGGGVVLSLADMAPERVASIVMLSAIGVQEHELLGGYRRNHLLHGIQLGFLWMAREGLPHFGLLDFPLDVEYARNFYDSDQRPLRAILERYRGPMLILHGTRDFLVPLAAAQEHHRLVPQSELLVMDEDHFTVFRNPAVLAKPIEEFLQHVQER